MRVGEWQHAAMALYFPIEDGLLDSFAVETIMKKILSITVAALVATSFSAVLFAEEVPYSEHRDAAPVGEMRRDESRRDEVKPMVQHKKQKKHHRLKKHKKQIRAEEERQH